jgi:uncharacterized protein YqeY
VLNSLQSRQKELQRPLSEDEELQVLQRERKRRVEAPRRSVPEAARSRPTTRSTSSRSSRSSCPSRCRRSEIEEIIDDVISEVGATNIRDMGRVMAGVMHQVSGRADGSVVSQLVKEKLA